MDALTKTFSSRGQTVSVDVFQLPEGRYPAIVFLHGADGLNLSATAYHWLATVLAERGYVVFLVHYFDGTDVKVAEQESIRKHFLRWGKTASDAVDFAREQPNVLPERIGLLGASLGASLALSLAAVRAGITAVAELYGLLPPMVMDFVKVLPPVLIVHGGRDRIVSVEEAHKLERILKDQNIPFEIKIYPEEGHIFSPQAARESAELTGSFFDKYLGEAQDSEVKETPS